MTNGIFTVDSARRVGRKVHPNRLGSKQRTKLRAGTLPDSHSVGAIRSCPYTVFVSWIWPALRTLETSSSASPICGSIGIGIAQLGQLIQVASAWWFEGYVGAIRHWFSCVAATGAVRDNWNFDNDDSTGGRPVVENQQRQL